MHLTEYFLVIKRKNRKPFIHSLAEQNKQQTEFFNDLKKTTSVDEVTARCVDRSINNLISSQPNEMKNNLNWENIWPNNDFGWTGPHLSDQESNHFAAIEALFRTSWAKKPENWKIIKERKLIGEDSTTGFVMLIGPPEIPNMFVVKSPKKFDSEGKPKNDSEGEIRYEYFVGKIVCNQIRKKALPNFPYYFGLIECSSIETPNNISDWCGIGLDTQLIMENVRNAEIFGRWFLNKSVGENVNVIAQVYNAILHAYLNYEFSHNDLHLMNLMIRQSLFPWTIELEADLGTLQVNYIAVIIDMGKATFKYKDQFSSIPLLFNQTLSFSVGYSRPVNDLIKFIVLIYRYIITLENDRFSLSKDIIRLKTVLSNIYFQFQQLLKSEKYNVQVHPTINDFALNGKPTWWNLPIEDPLISFENESFLKKFVKACFSEIFGPFLKEKWNPSHCPIKTNLIENQFKSFLLPESKSSNSSPPKKRKIEKSVESDSLDFLLNDITFDTNNFISSNPSTPTLNN